MEKFIFSKIIEAKDDIDNNIITSTINMIVGLNLDNLILDKVSHEKYFKFVMEITQSLLKANAHRRKYLEKEVEVIKDFKEACTKESGESDSGLNPLELNIEIEAVLSQIKSALDSLAKSLNPIFGLKLTGWHKKKKESGREVIDNLRKNISKTLQGKISQLINYIEINTSWLSYIVWLRDRGQHHGGIRTITDIIFERSSSRVLPQKIFHSEEESEEVSQFLNRLIKEITQFINGCLLISIIIKSPAGMGIQKNPNGSWPPYSWVINAIPKSAEAKD